MQNNTCIFGIKLNARKVFLAHKFTRRDICATHQLRHRRRFAWNDARHRSSAASVHRRHELAIPAAEFSPYFLINLVQIYAVGCPQIWLNKSSLVSLQKVDCLTRSVSRNIALLEDKEFTTNLTHERRGREGRGRERREKEGRVGDRTTPRFWSGYGPVSYVSLFALTTTSSHGQALQIKLSTGERSVAPKGSGG